ncbi:SusC/RagA family TonB-linked outer membrane protein [Rhodohalobacter mucosus]|uniref:SusC/RagA family TonB-linked outer membrane protein n=1 Tax=Rhodohalobacter mucosus TaxID=2079485 RepID=A0A316U3E6_9BACT|nr:SusC/RagA family TonB-linked outer membrane protein [Rhodohalobacter mucosus]PWN07956.1 SusC/RagA family TonB-linked outer membrane protein [Rhodohalobacter mucosus]
MKKRYYLKLLSAFAVLIFSAQIAAAQFTVSGTVTDAATGESLVGVSIFDPATNAGTTTNVDGEYSVELPAGTATLRFSFVGYVTRNLDVSGSDGETVTLDVEMSQDVANLEELVVTGLASTVKRSNLANSVSSITAEQIAQNNDPQTIDNALRGKIPGVEINSYSGAPGGGFNVQLRGVATLGAGGSQPLYIIDGVYVNNEFLTTGRSSVSGAGGNTQDDTANRLADINPDDIESIEVLKGPSAAAIYGQRANAGVVIIRTKQGRAGRTSVSFQQDVGFNSALNLLGRTEWTDERIDIYYAANPTRAALEKQRLSDAQAAGNVVDLEDYIYGNNGLINNTQIDVSGGNEKTRFFVSGAFNVEDGIIENTGFDRNSIRANIDHNITESIRVSSTSNFIRTDSERGFTGNQNNTGGSIGYSLAFHPNYAFDIIRQNEDGSYNDSPYFGENPLRLIEVATNDQKVNRYLQSVNLTADLYQQGSTLVSFTANGGFDYTNANSIIYFPEFMQFQRTAANFPGDVIHTTQEVLNTNLQAVLLVNTGLETDFGRFDFSTQVGATRFDQSINLDRIRGQGLLPGQTNVGNAAQVSASQNFTEITDFGLFAQEEINFSDKLIATFGGRWDKSTLNLNESEYYFYPKASLAANLTNFDFWTAEAFNQFKLRVAYGETGGLPNFGAIFSSLNGTNIGDTGGAVAPGTDVDPDLKPERAKEIEYGFDLALFDGRIGFEFTRYNKAIEDLILPLVPSPATGVNQITTNAAEMENIGMEIGLSAIPFRSNTFTWNTSVLWWTNETEITDLIIPAQTNTFYASPAFGATRLEEGVSPTGIYGFVPGQAEREIIGDLQPDFQMSFSNDFNFLGNFTAGFLVHWAEGSEGINLSQLLTDIGGNSPDFFDENNNVVEREGGTLSYLEDSSYIKLREASLFYNVPTPTLQRIAGNTLRGVRLGVTGTNLLMITDYTGYDPEVNATGRDPLNQRVDITPYPTSRKILFSIKVDL